MDTTEKRTPYYGRRGLRDGSVTVDKLAEDVRATIEEAANKRSIGDIMATVDDNIGTPSVDVVFEDGDLTMHFHNLRGRDGDTGIYDPDDPETPVLEVTDEKGDSDTKVFSQRGVTEIIDGVDSTDYETITTGLSSSGYYRPIPAASSSTTILAQKSASGFRWQTISCSEGDKFRIYGLAGTTGPQRNYGFVNGSTILKRGTTTESSDTVGTRTNPVVVTAPANTTALIVNYRAYDSTKDRVEKITVVHTDGLQDYIDEALESITQIESDVSDIESNIGDLSNLTTEDTDSLVDAIVEVNSKAVITDTLFDELEGEQSGGYIDSSHDIASPTSTSWLKNVYDVSGLSKVRILFHKGGGSQTGGSAKWYGFYSSASTIESSTYVSGNDTALSSHSNGDYVIADVPATAAVLVTSGIYGSSGNVYSTADEVIVTRKTAFDVIESLDGGKIEYKKNSNTIVFGNLYKSRKIGYTIGPGGANGLVDFRNIFFYDTDSGISSPANTSYLISSVGDMHSPFRFRSDSQTDDVSFTGGNHAYSSGSVKTAVLESVAYYVDGKLITASSEIGVCRNVKIIWINLVKAGNAYAAADDYALRETHTMYYDGIRFEEYVDLQPIVDIRMGLWYGLQLMPVVNQLFVLYVGGTNRELLDTTEASKSNDKTCSKFIAGNSTDIISMSIDNDFDIGDRRHCTNDTTHGAKHNAETGKSYFTIVAANYNVVMSANEHYWLHGYYEVGDNVNYSLPATE